MKYPQDTPTVRSDSLSFDARTRSTALRAWGLAGSLAGLASAPTGAWASFLSGEAVDTLADIIAVFVLFLVPIAGIVIFWLVHILPEKVAEKRHHPQKDSIKTLCLLSLVFGGLLWPIAWLWAYTKPVGYRLAYGTDKHDDYFHEMADQVKAGKLSRAEIAHLKDELDHLAAGRKLPGELKAVRDDLEAILSGAASADAKRSAP
jgi:CBS domain containing-hemolysin-like protein